MRVPLWELAAAALVLVWYLQTLHAGIPGGDSGEIVAEGCHFGVAHPPGYPLMTIVQHGAFHLAKGLKLGVEPSRLANALSAVFGASSVLFLALAGNTLATVLFGAGGSGGSGDKPSEIKTLQAQAAALRGGGSSLGGLGSAAAAAAYALSPLLWRYHVGAEVFAMNNAFVGLLFYMTSRAVAARALVLTGDRLATLNSAAVGPAAPPAKKGAKKGAKKQLANGMRKRRTKQGEERADASDAPADTDAGAAVAAAAADAQRTGASRLRQSILVGALVCGLGLCNQHTLVLFEAPMILVVLWAGSSVLTLGLAAAAGACFATGLAPYAQLPIAQLLWPRAGSWGYTATLIGFLRHLRRADYGTFQLYSGNAADAPGFVARTRAMAADFVTEQAGPIWSLLTVAALALVLVVVLVLRPGAGRFRASQAQSAALLLAVPLFYVVVFHNLSNMPLADPLLYGVHQRFWMQPFAAAFLLCGVALDGAARAGPSAATGPLARLIALALFAWTVRRSVLEWPARDQSGNRMLDEYAEAILEPLPPNAVLVTAYDMQWTSLRYKTVCEGFRSDVTVLNAPMLSFEWFQYQQRELFANATFPGTHLTKAFSVPHGAGAYSTDDFLAANSAEARQDRSGCEVVQARYAADKRFAPRDCVEGSLRSPAVFYAGDLMHKGEDLSFEFVPTGLARRAVPAGAPSLKAAAAGWAALKAWRAVERRFRPHPPAVYAKDTWEWTTGEDYWVRLDQTAAFALDCAVSDPGGLDVRLALEAADLFEELVNAAPVYDREVPTSVLKNLGLAYAQVVRGAPEPTQRYRVPRMPSLPGGTLAWSELKDEMAKRVLHMWERFLARRDARADPSFQQVSTVVAALRKARSPPA